MSWSGCYPQGEAIVCIERDLYFSRDNRLPTAARVDVPPRPLLCGDVSRPLALTAALLDGKLGDAGQMLTASTWGFGRLGVSLSSELALARRLTDGVGRAARPRLPAWAVSRDAWWPICLVCFDEYWRKFGVRGTCYDLFYPFVTVCATHGAALDAWSPSLPIPKLDVVPKGDLRAQRYAQVCKRLNEQSALGVDVIGQMREAVIAEGYQHANGDFKVSRFAQDFGQFCREQVADPALSRLALLPLRARNLLAALVHPDRPSHPCYLALLYWFAYIAPNVRANAPEEWPVQRAAPAPLKGQWHAKDGDDLALQDVDRRRRYGRRDAGDLLLLGCASAKVAELCGTTLDWIYRLIKREALWDAIKQARAARVRDDARATLLRLIENSPGCSVHQIGLREPRLLRWLQRHDQAWLTQHQHHRHPRTYSPRHVRAPRGRDGVLAARIRRTADAIRESRGIRNVSMAELAGELGSTPYALARCARSARVRAALEQAGVNAWRKSRQRKV
ncbi:TnsD family Tn7-like transposition protein [Cupriavidus sp. CuC1]|uniref:TnsD family Tn7-like transposition protein n=1 Tax=Cupriavidus sp. CuC1 TaxID=3373131 RepID=UPI0037D2A550